MRLELTKYDLTVKYIPRKTNVIADLLSRHPLGIFRTNDNTYRLELQRTEHRSYSVRFIIRPDTTRNSTEHSNADVEYHCLPILATQRKGHPHGNSLFLEYSGRNCGGSGGLIYRLHFGRHGRSCKIHTDSDPRYLATEFKSLSFLSFFESGITNLMERPKAQSK